MTKRMIDADELLDWIEVQSKKNYAKTFNSFFTSADFIKQEITRLKSLASAAHQPKEQKTLNWIPYTVENALEHDLINKKNNFIYLNAYDLIIFSRCVLTTHFALKSEYNAILPQKEVK